MAAVISISLCSIRKAKSNPVVLDRNGIAFSRTTRQVLNIV